jgi:cysteinyl-tRNA synthetase
MVELIIYNTLTRREEPFVPREPGKVAMYACGLTPQAPAHVGHMRGVVVMDIVQRWFEQLGYRVNFVQNFTDIDDKIIRRAHEEGIPTTEVARKYSQMYIEDAEALGVRLPRFVKVTDNMDAIIEMVQRLVDDGYAYVVDGDVYFEVNKFPEYGKLSGRSVEEMQAGARIEVDERKRNPEDFALWKAAKPGEPAWDSPWGKGRPGWHIECSALSLKYLGAAFDIHAGGMDLHSSRTTRTRLRSRRRTCTASSRSPATGYTGDPCGCAKRRCPSPRGWSCPSASCASSTSLP